MIVLMGTITLTDVERVELSRRAMSRAGRADDARRARLILLLDAGETWAAIREKLDCNDAFIDRWSKRYLAERLAGLFSRHAGQEASRLTPQLEARILEWTVKRKPADGSTHWSTRKLAEQLGISHMMVARVWGKHALRPQRLVRTPRTIAKRAYRQQHQSARPPLAEGILPLHLLDSRLLRYELQPFFRITACSASLSRLRSATSRVSRVFSSRSCFSSCPWLASSPPDFAFHA